jgi:hypothetical protein
MEIFYAGTTISLGNGRKTPFWHAPWLNGLMPKDIAPKIFEICKRKNWSVAHALHEDEWITKLAIDATTSINFLTQFVQFELTSKGCTFVWMWRMISHESSPSMCNIRRLPHTSWNFLALWSLA